MESTKEEEVNPFIDASDFLYKTFYEQPKNFVQHSLDDLTEDAVKVGFMYGTYYIASIYELSLPYIFVSVAVGYYVGNEVGDFAGEYVESSVKYYTGVEEYQAIKTQEGIFESLVDDIAEDFVKIVGLAYLLKMEALTYFLSANHNVEAQTGAGGSGALKALSIISGIYKYTRDYNNWNEYANKAGNFVAREVTEYCDSILQDDALISSHSGEDMCFMGDAQH
jgi:hypothetical protein